MPKKKEKKKNQQKKPTPKNNKKKKIEKKGKKIKKLSLIKILLIITVGIIIIGSGVSIMANSSINKIKEPSKKINQAFTNTVVVDQTLNWEIHKEQKPGFNLKYPKEIKIGKPGEASNKLILSIGSRKIENLNPENSEYGYDPELAKQDQAELKEGNFGLSFDNFVPETDKIVKLRQTNAKSFMVLSQDNLCNVTFERVLIFYNNEYQIIITLTGPKNLIMNSVDYLFDLDTENCGEESIWKSEAKEEFISLINKDESLKEIQNWYNTYDEIIETIKIEIPRNTQEINNKDFNIKISNPN